MSNTSLTSSRRRTPWDEKKSLSSSEKFVKNQYLRIYYNRHPDISKTDESSFLNGFDPLECRHCGSTDFIRYGYTSDHIRRYYCNHCHRTFTITTGTIFQDHKISLSEWVEQILQIIEYESSSPASGNGRNSFTTTKYWNAKIFDVLAGYQDNIQLQGNVEIDETYYHLVFRNLRMKGNGSSYRGISRNQMCIAVGTDGLQNLAVYENHEGKPTMETTWNAFGKHITRGSHILHDSERSHRILIDRLDLTEERFDSRELDRLPDADNPLRKVNHLCFLLKRFLNDHSGFNREELQGYLDLFSFMMNPPSEPLEKVRILLIGALYTHKVLKYRTYYSKKPHTPTG